jgi:hypothetical protein
MRFYRIAVIAIAAALSAAGAGSIAAEEQAESRVPVFGTGPTAEPGSLVLKVTPWAKVYIDGEYIDTTPISKPITVKSGKRKVILRNPHFKEWEGDVTITGGQNTEKRITLEPLEASYLKIKVFPWAKVYIDDYYMGTTPLDEPVKLTPGKHEVKLINPYFKVWSEQAELKKGETLEKNIRLELKK